MKAVPLLLLLVAGFVSGQDVDPFAPEDPFATEEPFASVDPFAPVEPAGPPRMIRVQVEFVEVAHADYTRLTVEPRESADATALRMKLAQMVEQDRAEVVETMMVVGRSGERATSEAVREFIYPTEYGPPALPCSFEVSLPPEDVMRNRVRIPATPTAFETRNLGSSLEVKPSVARDGKTVDLNLAPEMVLPAGYGIHQEFTTHGGLRHQVKMPTFISERVNLELTCRDGQYALAAVLTPPDDEGLLGPGRKMLVLVKCDVLVVE